MTIWSGSFPPPAPARATSLPVGSAVPTAFRSARGSASGSRGTVFVCDGSPGSVTLTGEFSPPSVLLAFRIGQVLLTFVMTTSLVAAMFVLFGRAEGTDVPPAFGVLMALVFASSIALVIWKAVLVRSTEAATLVVRTTELRRVRSTVNYRLLGWWLVIGPLALVPLFAGRRVLRMEVPVSVDGRVGLLPLMLLEQRHGDADTLAARLRLAGAR